MMGKGELLLLVILNLFMVLAIAEYTDTDDHPMAICKVEPATGDPEYPIEGTIIFEESGTDTTVRVNLQGFNVTDEYSYHGFHVHASGDLSDKCKMAGGHFNPMNVQHGGPTDDVRHVGDLGHIMEGPNGKIVTSIQDRMIKLSGEYSIIGKAIVIHEKEDDFGKGGDEGSLKTGNAGSRLGCCIIKEYHPQTAGSSTISSQFSMITTVSLALMFSLL